MYRVTTYLSRVSRLYIIYYARSVFKVHIIVLPLLSYFYFIFISSFYFSLFFTYISFFILKFSLSCFFLFFIFYFFNIPILKFLPWPLTFLLISIILVGGTSVNMEYLVYVLFHVSVLAVQLHLFTFFLSFI